MTDQTDRLASTVINLVLPDKVFVMACQRDWVLYSVSRTVNRGYTALCIALLFTVIRNAKSMFTKKILFWN